MKITQVIVGILIALGFFVKTEILHISLMGAGLGFQRDLSVTSAVSIGVLAIWLPLTCGVACAKTDWQPMRIGEPEWEKATFQFLVEIRKPGELTKKLVWVEIEEIRFEDGTRYDTINLPLKLRWTQDYNRALLQKNPERLIGRNRVCFLQFVPADTPRRYSAIRLIGADQFLNISDCDGFTAHSECFFLMSIHDANRRIASKWICVEVGQSAVERGPRARTVKRTPWEK